MWRLFDPDIITDDDRQSMAHFILTADQLSNGPVVKEFEKAWCEWQGCKYSVFVNSGSSANLLLVAAMKELYGTGAAVAQGVTWSTNVAPIMQLGFDLQLCDINLRNFGPDLVSLERILSDTKCKFLFLTHLLGFNGLSDDLLELLDKYNVKLIEDCCESTGTTFKGVKAGNYGAASSFSFYFAHHFTTVEGGMVCTDDEELWKLFRLLRSHGLSRELPEPVVVDGVDPKFTFLVPGFNVRNTELYAHLGLRQLKKLDDIIAHRNANVAVLLENLDPELYYTDMERSGVSSFALPIICHEERQRVRAGEIMDELGIENRPFVSGSMFKQPMIQRVNCRRFDKNSEFMHRHAIYAGNHAQVSAKGVEMLCEKLNQ